MDRVELFHELLEDESPVFRKYMLRSGKWKNASIFIFEGDDEKYYTPSINIVFGHDWKSFIAGSRDKVLSLRLAIRNNKQFRNDKCIFFIDKDFSNDFSCDDLYVTPTHSIENLYCDEYSVRALIRGEAGFSKIKSVLCDEDDLLDDIVAKYRSARSLFLNAKNVKKLNTLLFIYISSNSDLKLNINDNVSSSIDFFLDEFGGEIAVNVSLIVRKPLETLMRDHVVNKVKNIPHFRTFVRQHRRNRLCRGKQEAQFLCSFIEDINRGAIGSYIQTKLGRKVNIRFNGNASELLSFGSQYAVRSPELHDFLVRGYAAQN